MEELAETEAAIRGEKQMLREKRLSMEQKSQQQHIQSGRDPATASNAGVLARKRQTSHPRSSHLNDFPLFDFLNFKPLTCCTTFQSMMNAKVIRRRFQSQSGRDLEALFVLIPRALNFMHSIWNFGDARTL